MIGCESCLYFVQFGNLLMQKCEKYLIKNVEYGNYIA